MSSNPKGSASRFECASSSLKLGALLKKTRGAAWICLAVGVCAHGSLTGVRGIRAEQKAAKRLTAKFVKRQPRLTKPLELRKRPQPRQRRMQRKMVSVKARMERDQGATRFQPVQALSGLARPGVEIGRIAGFDTLEIEPRSTARSIEGTKEVEQRIDMSLELMDIDALDTGKYHALVIQDPTDKRKHHGFLPFCEGLFKDHAPHIQCPLQRMRRAAGACAEATGELH